MEIPWDTLWKPVKIWDIRIRRQSDPKKQKVPNSWILKKHRSSTGNMWVWKCGIPWYTLPNSHQKFGKWFITEFGSSFSLENVMISGWLWNHISRIFTKQNPLFFGGFLTHPPGATHKKLRDLLEDAEHSWRDQDFSAIRPGVFTTDREWSRKEIPSLEIPTMASWAWHWLAGKMWWDSTLWRSTKKNVV